MIQNKIIENNFQRYAFEEDLEEEEERLCEVWQIIFLENNDPFFASNGSNPSPNTAVTAFCPFTNFCVWSGHQ